jgi:small ligand-binding sensory domain FIST
VKAGGALVLTEDPGVAASRAVAQARDALGNTPPSLAVLFASPHFLGSADALVAAVAAQAGPVPLIGCVGESVVGGGRDAESADEDLRRALTRESAALGGRRPAGALLFTCNGRGSRLFAEPDHDAGLITTMLGDVPLAGFFCAGELGPIGGQNFLHTFTASIALFPDPA